MAQGIKEHCHDGGLNLIMVTYMVGREKQLSQFAFSPSQRSSDDQETYQHPWRHRQISAGLRPV